MKIGLIGHGKTGKEVERYALAAGHTIVGFWTTSQRDDLSQADVWIDFSSHQSVIEHVQAAADAKKPIVIGTTAWGREESLIKEIVTKAQIGAIFSPNFAIGVHLFVKTVEALAKMAAKLDFDPMVLEWHHREKKDSPSGTALVLKNILETLYSKTAHLTSENAKLPADEFHAIGIRGGFDPGTYTVTFDSPSETIELTHRARSREPYARGALLAAEWIRSRTGFYTMDDLI